MLHSYRMYINEDSRKVPRLVDEGTIELPCSNPSAPRYARMFDPRRLWAYLERNVDLDEPGLYLSLVAMNEPTVEGKRWFILTAYEDNDNQNYREVSWVNVSDLVFWNPGFRMYTLLNQYPGIRDYGFYVSRCFGYCFLVVVDYDDENDIETVSHVDFYPSTHHWHRKVMVNESEIFRPFSENEDWFMRSYSYDSDDEDAEPTLDDLSEVVQRITDAAQQVEISMNEVAEIDFADYVSSTPWLSEDDGEPEEDENG